MPELERVFVQIGHWSDCDWLLVPMCVLMFDDDDCPGNEIEGGGEHGQMRRRLPLF